ncbi:MAG: RNA polymerase sigma factor [Pseudomonadota bacterium]
MSSQTLVMMQTMFTPSDSAASAGSTQRLDLFLRSVERQAFKMAHYATSDSNEALDIVQDAMTAFVRRYREKPEPQWRPLFFRSVDNRIKDWFRRRKVRSRWQLFRSREDAPDPVDSAPAEAPTPDAATGHSEAGVALEAALRALPDRQRQAFLLRTWQGLSVAETARAMGCSDGSVKTHLSRAMSALRNQLTDFDPLKEVSS